MHEIHIVFQSLIYLLYLFAFSVGTYKIQGKENIYEVIDESLKVGFRSIGKSIE